MNFPWLRRNMIHIITPKRLLTKKKKVGKAGKAGFSRKGRTISMKQKIFQKITGKLS